MMVGENNYAFRSKTVFDYDRPVWNYVRYGTLDGLLGVAFIIGNQAVSTLSIHEKNSSFHLPKSVV
jgi:hypothetical protein